MSRVTGLSRGGASSPAEVFPTPPPVSAAHPRPSPLQGRPPVIKDFDSVSPWPLSCYVTWGKSPHLSSIKWG